MGLCQCQLCQRGMNQQSQGWLGEPHQGGRAKRLSGGQEQGPGRAPVQRVRRILRRRLQEYAFLLGFSVGVPVLAGQISKSNRANGLQHKAKHTRQRTRGVFLRQAPLTSSRCRSTQSRMRPAPLRQASAIRNILLSFGALGGASPLSVRVANRDDRPRIFLDLLIAQ